MKQTEFFKKEEKPYGGSYLTTRKARSKPRPLDTKNTMHLVLRSSKATGEWSFNRSQNSKNINKIVDKFALKYGVRILSLANVGNHLHFQIKLSNRFTYKPFIRAITAAIAMAITGASRWNSMDSVNEAKVKKLRNSIIMKAEAAKTTKKFKFWDCRPFTRVVQSYRAVLNLRDYIRVNQLEGFGVKREQARFILAMTTLRDFG